MTWLIRSGGVGIIIAVFGIFLFIGWQVLPLFFSATVTEVSAVPLPAGLTAASARGMISDEWGELPAILSSDGRLAFIPQPAQSSAHGAASHPPATAVPAASIISLDLGEGPGSQLTASTIDPRTQRIIAGTADGRLAVRRLSFSADNNAAGVRTITGDLKSEVTIPFGTPGKPLRAVGYGDGDGGSRKLAAAIQDVDGALKVLVVPLTQKRSLVGSGTVKIGDAIDLTSRVIGTPRQLLVDERGDSVVVATSDGSVFYFFASADGFDLRQTFRPFEDQGEATISSINYLLGDVSLVLTNPKGVNRIFSLHVRPGTDHRTFGQTKEFDPLHAGAETYAPSVRNKAFLVTDGKQASLRYGTSAAIRWEQDFPFPITQSAISGKYHRLFLLDDQGTLHTYDLDDPHPEAGMTALFGKVWYEGADAPKYDWQSSGASDDFEPKLSMIPLLVGSFKGTIYALLFALPIAILGAVYTAEFMHPRFKSVVKPVIEIMASLPSVVLGFLAAIWLAPLVEEKVPSMVMVVLALPVVAALFGWIWTRTPMHIRSRIRPGSEFIWFMPLLILTLWGSWSLGPMLETLVFTGDFRQWWRDTTGLSFEQRNSLVVGIMMGFAVIPIIFTIAEDALANVPPSLRSASLALGASRWQTALYVVLPTASAGIFSAVMIGFGRAIGETMIVVMATGNTAIMSMNIFDGMRTLSANIAVELPEAAVHSTLFRTLFLGALLLFLLTFLVNTVAELMRQHLREKYKTV